MKKIHGIQKGFKSYLKYKQRTFYRNPKLCVKFQIKITMFWTLILSGKISWKTKVWKVSLKRQSCIIFYYCNIELKYTLNNCSTALAPPLTPFSKRINLILLVIYFKMCKKCWKKKVFLRSNNSENTMQYLIWRKSKNYFFLSFDKMSEKWKRWKLHISQ